MNEVLEKIQKIGIVPVVVLDDAKDAAPLAKALCEGGLPCAEVTLSLIHICFTDFPPQNAPVSAPSDAAHTPRLFLLIPGRGSRYSLRSEDQRAGGPSLRHWLRYTPWNGEIPVSYTHLDVYKRQFGNC